jgi:type I restriction enzyme S subunit
MYFFNSTSCKKLIEELAFGVTRLRIDLSMFKSFPIPLPPLEEQHEIVRRVETLFAYADRLEARYTAARAQVERLIPALLAKAFRGELVPQDPNDEPAAVLLARLRAAREAAPIKSRPRKGSGQPKTQKAEVTMLNGKDIQDALSR